VLQQYTTTDAEVGCFLDTTGRRFLTIADMVNIGGSDLKEARSTIDRLVGVGVFRRGLLLKCDQCLHLGWYAAEAIGQQFTCARCTTNQTIVAASWRLPVDEPSWFYDLTEVVYQAFLHNAHIPVLAIKSLKTEGGRRPFDFTTDLDVFRDGAKIDEIDFVAVADGQVIVGEAKKGNALTNGASENAERRAVSKLVQVADGLSADIIVIASASAAFKRATVDNLETEAAHKGIAVRIMTSVGGGDLEPEKR
jgi:hypothetical protein